MPIGLAQEVDALTTGFRYQFATATADADPGAGFLRFNNATLGSVSQIYIDPLSFDGLDLTTLIDSFDDGGSSANRGTIVIDQTANGAFFVGTVTGSVTSASGYRKISVTPVASAGTFIADAVTSFHFLRSGADGANATRQGLTANRTYYVRTDGSNSNTGLVDSAGGAFLTVQKAVDVVFGTLDLGGFDVDIQLRTGTFARAVVVAPQVGLGNITIRGDAGTPANVVMTATAIGEPSGVIETRNGATLFVKDLTLTCATSGSGLQARNGGKIYHQNLRFGACANYHMHAASEAYIQIDGNYAIVGAAQVHMRPGSLSEIRVSTAVTVTITGTPAFSVAFIQAYILGVAANLGQVTWSGSATGKRFEIFENSDVNGLSSLTALPGDVAGTVASGGIYGSALREAELFMVAVTDLTTAIGAGTFKVKFRMPYALTLTEIPRASLYTVQTSGSIFTVDINKSNATILSTKLTIDNGESTSKTAATPAVLSSTTLADDEEISVDVDQVGDGTARGLIITLIGFRT